jgi:phage baseplate assembly protein W
LEVSQFGGLNLADDVGLIQQSIYSILDTPRGSRFMLREYGSDLHSLIFEPSDEVLMAMLEEFIIEALEKWESRIRIIDVGFDFDYEKGAVNCQISARILLSNQIESFVYPFYRELKY